MPSTFALDLRPGTAGNPIGTNLLANDLSLFTASFADVDIDDWDAFAAAAGARPEDTIITGGGSLTVNDEGIRTRGVPPPHAAKD